MTAKKVTKEYTEYDKKIREYYLKCFLSEFSKIIIFFITFLFLDLLPQYIIALLTLMVLRNNGGGLHFKHYLSCLLVSFFFLYGSIYLATYITPPRLSLCICTFFCSLAGYCLVPITSANRPSATLVQIRKSKQKTIIIIFVFFILMCICPLNKFLYIVYWTVILHIVQLIIAQFIKEVTVYVGYRNKI